MGQWNLDKEYQLLVEQGLARGDVSVRTDGPDLRETPRIRMRGGRVAVRLEPEFDVVDISAGGLAFLSEVPFDEGEVLNIILKDTVAFQGRVIASQLIETNPVLLELRYRVHVRFYTATSGKQLLVLMHEMEGIDDAPRLS